MSIDIHYAKHRPLQSSPSVIKSESQMIVERESFRQIFHDDKDQELILQIYGKHFRVNFRKCSLELLRCVRDLEHPYTLEQIDVVNPKDIEVKRKITQKDGFNLIREKLQKIYYYLVETVFPGLSLCLTDRTFYNHETATRPN
jgi:hypothetical protein